MKVCQSTPPHNMPNIVVSNGGDHYSTDVSPNEHETAASTPIDAIVADIDSVVELDFLEEISQT